MEEKWVRNSKIQHFLGKTRKWYRTKEWYRYQRVVPVPTKQRRSGTDTTQSGIGTHWQCGTSTSTSQSGIGTTAFDNPIFAYFCTVKSRIFTPIV